MPTFEYNYGAVIFVIALLLATLIAGYHFHNIVSRRDLLREQEDLQAILPVSTGAAKKAVEQRLDQIQGLL